MTPSLVRVIRCMVFVIFCLGVNANAFTHPGIPLTTSDLDYVKARLNVQPWKSGWDALQADGQASLGYTMQGPFATVSRTPNVNQYPWRNDMSAIYKLALRGYYSGDVAYSAKALAIWRAWISTMTTYGGSEAYLDIGDYAQQMIGGADILRGTYAGWTAQDTTDSINYFQNVIRPALMGAPRFPVRGANQGMAQIKSAMGIAAFCDDTTYWNESLFAWRNDAHGLADTAPMGMVGDSGRDQAHTRGQLMHYAWGAAVAWSQGVDFFSERDNRLAKCAEYFSKYTLYNTVPYVTFGSLYGFYPTIGPDSRGADLPFRSVFRTAYVTRKGMDMPWISRASDVFGDAAGFEFLRLDDTSTATYSPLSFPEPRAAVSGAWTNTGIGNPGQTGGSSYNNDTWTVTGGGANVYYSGTSNDQFHFAYKAMTSDFTFVARVLGVTGGGTNRKGGLMVRDSLSGNAKSAAVYMTPTTIEAIVRSPVATSHSDLVRTFIQSPPYWIKVERRGEWIGRYCSPDGINWQPMNYTLTTMTGTVYVGLMACANNNSQLTTATMDNVAISDASGLGVVPLAPTSLTATPGKSQITLNWLPGAGTSTCKVQRSLSAGGPFTTIAEKVPAAFYTDIDLTNGTTYYYQVSGENSVGSSPLSSIASTAPDALAPVPAAPGNLTVLTADGTADLTWDAVPGATHYNVKRSTVSGGSYTRVFYGQDRDVTNFSDLGLTNGQTYYYTVHAVNAVGESLASTQVTATPQRSLVWTGGTNGTWNTSQTGNWTDNGSPVVYSNGQPVQFDDTAAVFNLAASSAMSPSSVLIRNTNVTYTFSTTGIGGSAHVTKRGTGTLTLNASQPFTGGMDINDPCTINFYGSTASIGTGTVAVNADTLLYATSTISWGGNFPNGFSISPQVELEFGGDRSVFFNGPLTGAGSLRLTPGSHGTTCRLSGNNSAFAGNVHVGGALVTQLNTTNSGSANAVWNLTSAGNRLASNVSGSTFSLGAVTNDPGIVANIFNNITASVNTATFSIGNNVSYDTDPVFDGAFIDNGNGKLALTKVGTNTQILNGANTYTGPTSIQGGVLVLPTTTTGGGAISVSTGATLGVANKAASTSLVSSSLSLASGARVSLRNIADTVTAPIQTGNLTISGACPLVIEDATSLVNGVTYPLIQYSGTLTGSTNDLKLSLPAGWAGTLSVTGTVISMTVQVRDHLSIWTGGETSGEWNLSNNWDFPLDPAFSQSLVFVGNTQLSNTNDIADGTARDISFLAGAGPFVLSGNPLILGGPIFNNSASLQTLGMNLTLAATRTMTTTSGGGDLALNGILSGAGGITTAGSGTLVLGGANDFTGDVTIASGTTLHLGHPSALGSSAGNLILAAGGTLDLYGNSATRAVLTASTATATLHSTTSATLTTNYQNTGGIFGGLRLTGNASLALVGGSGSGNPFGANPIVIGTGSIQLKNNSGVIRMNNIDTNLGIDGDLVFDGGGQLQHTTNKTFLVGNSVIVNGTGNTWNYQQNGSVGLTLQGSFTGAGTLTTAQGFNAALVLSGDMSGFTGTWNFQNHGTTSNNSTSLRFTNTSATTAGSASAVFTQSAALSGNVGTNTIEWSGTGSRSISLGDLTTTASGITAFTPGSTRLRNNTSGTTATFLIGALGLDSTYAGEISNGVGTTAIRKDGTGTWTLTGNSTHTGGTTIAGGTLLLTGNLSGNGSVTVLSGARLAGSGSIAGNTVVQNLGMIAPGGTSPGTLTLNGPVELQGGARLQVRLGTTSDQLALASTYTGPSSGSVLIEVASATGYGPGTYDLITGATGIQASQFTLAALPSGLTGNLSSSGGTLTLTLSNALPPLSALELTTPTLTFQSGLPVFTTATSTIGRFYQLQRSTTLEAASWQDIGSALPGTGSALILTDPLPPTPRAFYRIAITP